MINPLTIYSTVFSNDPMPSFSTLRNWQSKNSRLFDLHFNFWCVQKHLKKLVSHVCLLSYCLRWSQCHAVSMHSVCNVAHLEWCFWRKKYSCFWGGTPLVLDKDTWLVDFLPSSILGQRYTRFPVQHQPAISQWALSAPPLSPHMLWMTWTVLSVLY